MPGSASALAFLLLFCGTLRRGWLRVLFRNGKYNQQRSVSAVKIAQKRKSLMLLGLGNKNLHYFSR